MLHDYDTFKFMITANIDALITLVGKDDPLFDQLEDARDHIEDSSFAGNHSVTLAQELKESIVFRIRNPYPDEQAITEGLKPRYTAINYIITK